MARVCVNCAVVEGHRYRILMPHGLRQSAHYIDTEEVWLATGKKYTHRSGRVYFELKSLKDGRERMLAADEVTEAP